MSWFASLRAGFVDLFERQVLAWPMAVFRIVLGISTYVEARHNVLRMNQYTEGQYHLTYFPFLEGLPYEDLITLCEWHARLAWFVILGVFSRVFAVAIMVIQGYLFLISQLNFRNHVYFTLLLLGMVAISRSDRVLSLTHLLRMARSWLQPPKEGSETREPLENPFKVRIEPTGFRLVQMQIVILYFYAALHKLALGFAPGYTLCRFLGREIDRGRSGEWLQENFPETLAGWEAAMTREACSESVPAAVVFFSIATIVVEFLLAIGLPFRKILWFAIATGVGMHLGIWWSMDVVTFGLMMVGTYPLFVAEPFGTQWVKASRTAGERRVDAPEESDEG